MANWISLNGFDGNEDRVEKILKQFGINKYHYTIVNGLTALIIEINLNVYWLEIDDFNEELVIRKKTYTRRNQRQRKEYMSIIKSFKNDCLYMGIKYVANDGKNRLT